MFRESNPKEILGQNGREELVIGQGDLEISFHILDLLVDGIRDPVLDRGINLGK